MWVHVRSNWWLGRGIRYALNKWERRVCRKLGVPFVEVWGNHDGLIMTPSVPHAGADWGVAEALAQGEVVTPLDQYEKDLESGHLEVRVFEVIPRTETENIREIMWRAAVNWETDCSSHPYDYWAYVGLILKAIFDIDVSTANREHFWCTEGCQDSFHPNPPKAPDYDVLQDGTPTPMHVEQVADLIPRPNGRARTLQEITDEVME
jgi:hypothetical protein